MITLPIEEIKELLQAQEQISFLGDLVSSEGYALPELSKVCDGDEGTSIGLHFNIEGLYKTLSLYVGLEPGSDYVSGVASVDDEVIYAGSLWDVVDSLEVWYLQELGMGVSKIRR